MDGKYIYGMDRSYGGLILNLLILVPIVVLCYPLWLPLGIISTALYLFLIYKALKKFPLNIYLYESHLELEYLKFANKFYEKIPLGNIEEIEGIYTTGRNGEFMLKIKSNDNFTRFELGGSSSEQHDLFFLLLKHLIDLGINTKLTSTQSIDITQSILKKFELSGRIIKRKSFVTTFKLEKSTKPI